MLKKNILFIYLSVIFIFCSLFMAMNNREDSSINKSYIESQHTHKPKAFKGKKDKIPNQGFWARMANWFGIKASDEELECGALNSLAWWFSSSASSSICQ